MGRNPLKSNLLVLATLLAVITSSATAQGSSENKQASRAELQDPEIPPALRASLRVDPANSEIIPSVIEITRGDTITIEGILRDAEGNRVTGAHWGIFDRAGIFKVEPIKHEKPDTYLLWGEGVGETRLRAVLIVPVGRRATYRELLSIPVQVKEWPVARVEIDEPAFGPYVGGSFELMGRVITTHDTEHSQAVIGWSSGDPDVAAITPDGTITFNKPGRVEIHGVAEGVEELRVIDVLPNPVANVSMQLESTAVRTGDVMRPVVRVEDRGGRPLTDVYVEYSIEAAGELQGVAAAYEDGAYVVERPGDYRLIATAGGRSAAIAVAASARGIEQEARVVGRGPVAHVETSDLWVFEGLDGRDYAYTGTHARGGGQRMFVWDVTDPMSPSLTDSVMVDARVVNDVKVNEEATIAVITREAASDRRNGIVILDISEPAHPQILSTFTENLTAGVHNVWIEGDLVYVINDGTLAVHIVDISDPSEPVQVGRWEIRPGSINKYLHDIWIKDGFAYVSYWDDGLFILDVGAGIKGGTAIEPELVSFIKYPEGNTHTAFRYGDYVYVGDEFIRCAECTNGPRGFVHVIDVSDIEDPREVARFEVPEAGAHNVWVEDDRLYIAYYQGGLRVVDVSGELRGDLYAQGRQIGWYHTAGATGESTRPGSTMAWGPQVYKGLVYVSDRFSGLWVIQLEPPETPKLP